MSYLFRIVLALLILLAGYSLFGIGHFKWMHFNVNNPKAEFLVSGNKNSNINFVEFLNYGCGYCKELHPIIEELKQVRKDIRYVVRPIALAEYEEDSAGHIAIAAGFQGKFEEISQAFLEYPEPEIPEDFVKETAELYGLDYDKLIEDSKSKKVDNIMQKNSKALGHIGGNSVPSFVVNKKIYIITDSGIPDLKQLLNTVPTSAN